MSLLPNADAFKRLVDGTSHAPAARAARTGLSLLAVPYSAAVRCRNVAYDLGLFPVHACDVPVICVGNLTLGGTGKTPLVAWVVRHLQRLGIQPAVVSRGYAAKPGERSDEAAELALLLPGVNHVADKDRVAAARKAVAAGAGAIVLDDGFQHRRLDRDLDIVAIDATDPFGCGRLFPRGLLREPLAGLARADVIVLTRATLVDVERREEIREQLRRHCRGGMPRVWAEATHRLIALRQASGSRLPLGMALDRPVVAFAGIGNPAAFQASLVEIGGTPKAFRPFADHHAYSPEDIADLGAWARSRGAAMILTTLKDLVKIGRDDLGGIPLMAAELEIDILGGIEALAAQVDRAVNAAATSASRRGACASAAEGNTS
ncbi:MAG: tetraacyldisaccharide 4'-kinase [Planctomycetia bacterium]